MSRRTPRWTAADVIATLERAGFQLVRQRGSHRIYRNAQGKRVTVPVHGSRSLHPKLLRAILRDAKLMGDTPEEDR
ncbi:TPA: type II toxin-antitoxin system HicA family toxin [Candidatus Acetothermia bacterium]|nr:type II toxin-antitoxin system HicA family toxin [Candidatus Acetothermia bacterium]